MRKIDFLWILKFIAFVAIMFVSTWATVESGNKLLPGWPKVMIWIISIIFFLLASWGVHLIFKSFDKSKMLRNRGWIFIAGLLITLTFWLIFILPTNTHTFFYKSVIRNMALNELDATKTEIDNLIRNGKNRVDEEQQKLVTLVNQDYKNLEYEIINTGRPGVGKKASLIISKISEEIGSKVNEPNPPKATLQDRKRFLTDIRSTIVGLLEIKLQEMERKKDKLTDAQFVNKINNLSRGIALEKKYVTAKGISRESTVQVINESNNVIKDFNETREKTSESKKEVTLASTAKIGDLTNVYQVWKNFFSGEYKGMGFIYWILLAVLIDLAGFILFHITFKND